MRDVGGGSAEEAQLPGQWRSQPAAYAKAPTCQRSLGTRGLGKDGENAERPTSNAEYRMVWSSDLRPPTSDLRPPTSDLRPLTSDLRLQTLRPSNLKPSERAT